MKNQNIKKIIRLSIFVFVCILLASVIGFGVFLKGQYVVPILMYHRVNDTAPKSDVLTVRPKTFERQMKFLRDNKYNVISFDEFADLIKTKSRIPKKTVLITFDDGWVDNYDFAYPILKKYNIPATIFVMTSVIDKDFGMLSSKQMKEMVSSGLIEIGSHTVNHACLSKVLTLKDLEYEIIQSKKDLEKLLNREIKFISYPIGGFSPLVRDIVIKAGYKAAMSVNSGKRYPDYDLFGLKRIRISENAKNLFVFWFESSGYYTYFKERKSDRPGKGSYIQCQLVR